ncbi:MAG: hypothetical protein IJW76_09850 [Clostridia bacterium]|nr:hypothetical protein [Clostridia bacterium]
MEQNDNNKSKKAFQDFMNRASDIGKKAADEIQKGAKNLSEQTKKTIYEQRMKKYNPLFKEIFKSKQFKIPNVIEIVDDAIRRDIDVCDGAIGWTDKINDVEILHLYDEWVKDSKVTFLPNAKCDAVYCIDPFDRNKFINVNSAFERTTSEKLAELEHIAYCLGAKSCSIEIVESNTKIDSAKFQIGAQSPKPSAKSDNNYYSTQTDKQGGKNVSYFEGNNSPYRPSLKWFAYDDNINGLIEMRCSGNNYIKSKILELNCASSLTMSHKTAYAIDKILKVKSSMSMEKKAIIEYSSKLIFEIEF